MPVVSLGADGFGEFGDYGKCTVKITYNGVRFQQKLTKLNILPSIVYKQLLQEVTSLHG